MDIQALIDYLGEGADAETKAQLAALAGNGQVKGRAAALRQQKDLDEIEAKRVELAKELDGEGENNPGARSYRDWVEKNKTQIRKLATLETKFTEKYGSVDAALAATDNPNPNPAVQNPPAGGVQLTEKQIKEMVEAATDARIRDGYSGRWSSLLTGVGTIVQKHMYAKRKEPIDFKKLEDVAAKYNGDLNLAYDEYDKPEREKESQAAQAAEIDRRVNEELQKRGASTYFPSGADATPGTLSAHRDSKNFDKAAMERELVQTFVSGQYPGEPAPGGSRGGGFFGAN